MNLYLISQDVNDDYDTYDSAVVAAESETEARLIIPWAGMDGENLYSEFYSTTWTTPENVKVLLIGTAVDGTAAGVVLASFNAG